MSTEDGPRTRRRRAAGRPRSPRIDAAILDAALELLAESGLEGLSVEAVAARAGVSKAAIYRRWPSRDEMVAAAFRSVTTSLEVPETGNVRDDLVELLAGFQSATLRSLPGHLVPRLVAATVSNPELLRVFLANVYAPRRAALLAVLKRGVERGQLRRDVDLNLCLAMIVGPLLHAALLDAGALSSDLLVQLVDSLLAGIAAPER